VSTSEVVPGTLGRWDLVLFKIVVNINNVPPVAVNGWASLALWLVAFFTSRVAALVGALATLGSIVAAFIPTADVTSVAWFEAKLVLAVAGPVAVGWILFRRTQQSRLPLAV
jgi:hypothetical protein